MRTVKQLYQLQEVDLELEANEQAVKQITSELGESVVAVSVRNKLVLEQQRLEDSKHQQHSMEWEIDGTIGKIATVEEELYSGRIHDSKELTNLQHEIDALKAKRAQLEDKALEIMDQIELTTQSVATINSHLEELETEWHNQQQELSANLEQRKTILNNLQQKRQLLTAEIDSQVIEVYHGLKKHKGTAVAKVEQGICRGCHISLPITELQRVRSGNLVRCGSCGRILFLA